jgi:glycosyltransferase involved in cell wall biosynthesis
VKLLMLGGPNRILHGERDTFYSMLSEFSRYWDRIDIICLADGKSKIEAPCFFGNVFLHPVRSSKMVYPIRLARLGRYLQRSHNHDLVVSHDFGFQYVGLGALLMKPWKTSAWVSEIHHVEGYPRSDAISDFFRKKAAFLFIRLAKNKVRAFRSVNRNEIPKLLAGTLRVPISRIRIIPSAFIDPDIFLPLNRDKKFDLLFCGRLEKNKGVHLQIRAVSILKKKFERSGIRFRINGQGSQKAKLKRLADRLGVNENIEWIDRAVSPAEMARIYNESRIMLCTSYAEGGPRVVPEAMACGTAVIATPVGIIPEMIRDGFNGFIVDWDAGKIAEAIDRLLSDETSLDSFSKRGRETVQGMGRESVVRNYALEYQKIVRDPPT